MKNAGKNPGLQDAWELCNLSANQTTMKNRKLIATSAADE